MEFPQLESYTKSKKKKKKCSKNIGHRHRIFSIGKLHKKLLDQIEKKKKKKTALKTWVIDMEFAQLESSTKNCWVKSKEEEKTALKTWGIDMEFLQLEIYTIICWIKSKLKSLRVQLLALPTLHKDPACALLSQRQRP